MVGCRSSAVWTVVKLFGSSSPTRPRRGAHPGAPHIFAVPFFNAAAVPDMERRCATLNCDVDETVYCPQIFFNILTQLRRSGSRVVIADRAVLPGYEVKDDPDGARVVGAKSQRHRRVVLADLESRAVCQPSGAIFEVNSACGHVLTLGEGARAQIAACADGWLRPGKVRLSVSGVSGPGSGSRETKPKGRG